MVTSQLSTRRVKLFGYGLLVATTSSCAGPAVTAPDQPLVPVAASVVISPQTAILNGVGDTLRLRAEVRDSRGSPMSTGVTWSVSDPSILQVSDQGSLTARAAGVATVTASAGTVTGTASIEVRTNVQPLVVSVLDVAQGDAIWIRNGRTKILVDGGQSQSRMASFISENNLQGDTIHLMVISHGHLDHYGGLAEFFKSANNITIREVLENGDLSPNVTLQSLRDSIRAREGRGQLLVRLADDPCRNASPICTFTMDGGALLHMMRPLPAGDTNNRSIPLKLVGPDSASFSMWLSGDAEHEAIAYFIAQYSENPRLKVNVLKGNHHGSCNGWTTDFLAAASPQIATFGVGATNNFGHVHNQTKDAFQRLGIQWLRSDINGRVTFSTAGTPNSGFTWIASASSALSQSGQGDRAAAASTCG